MERSVFKVRGSVVDLDNDPLNNVVVAIVDEDAVSDDLIGVGVTVNGGFQLSFTAEAFNQEPMELEGTPDLYLVLSVTQAGSLVAVRRVDFTDRRFEHDEEDLGTIEIPFRPGEAPKAVPNLAPLPGYKKRVRRLTIDDEVLTYAVEEIAPLVEALTGWEDVSRGIRVEAVEHGGEAFARLLSRAGLATFSEAEVRRSILRSGIAGSHALYDPFSASIYVDVTKTERQNLDGLKVIIGHELVHAGQFQHHPQLVQEYRELLEAVLAAERADRAGGGTATLSGALGLGKRGREASKKSFGFMANLEGYASYIENDFIRKVLNCAQGMPHLSIGEELVQFLLVVEGVLQLSRTEHSMPDKYAVGREVYRAMQKGDRPVRFEPTLRIEPDDKNPTQA
jgi:hypothetical protein